MTELDTEPEDLAPTGSVALAEAAGITYRQLDNWTRLGHLRPVDPEPGTGKAREWPEPELEIARRMGRLVNEAGLPLTSAARMARDSWPTGELSPGIVITVTEETHD